MDSPLGKVLIDLSYKKLAKEVTFTNLSTQVVWGMSSPSVSHV